MSFSQIITTFLGSFLYVFFLTSFFGSFSKNKILSAYIGSFVIIGLFWVINHGIQTSMIYQSGKIWIDMAVASGIGVITRSFIDLKKRNIKGIKIVNIYSLSAAIVGGCIAGIILYLMRL